MAVSHRTFSRKGATSTVNRDVLGHERYSDLDLFVVLDGASTPGSGELALALCEHVLSAFPRLCEAGLNLDNAEHHFRQLIEVGRQKHCSDHPKGKASILVFLLGPDYSAVALHAGDCCLGVITAEGTIQWFTPPHCLPNWQGGKTHAELATLPQRHILTRCITLRRKDDLAIARYEFAGGTKILLSTDGFWACLTQDQQQGVIDAWAFDALYAVDDLTVVEITTHSIVVYP